MKTLLQTSIWGTKLAREIDFMLKTILGIDNKSILYQFKEFIILVECKCYYIKNFFSSYLIHQSNINIYMNNDSIETHNDSGEPWKVILLNRGLIYSRIVKRIKKYQEYLW